jgi:hypothetical protein
MSSFRLARDLSPALLLVMICGCTSLEWRHTESGEHDVDRDQAQCLAQARFETRQRLPLQAAPVPQVIVDQQGRSIVTQNTPPDSERFFLEQNLLRQCMSERGYTLQAKPEKPE